MGNGSERGGRRGEKGLGSRSKSMVLRKTSRTSSGVMGAVLRPNAGPEQTPSRCRCSVGTGSVNHQSDQRACCPGWVASGSLEMVGRCAALVVAPG
jgi:hypothetical protein